MPKYLQINLSHCKAAQALLSQVAAEKQISYSLVNQTEAKGHTGTWTNLVMQESAIPKRLG